ncbi:unnamed protein product [Strongylus vulgaris]|uniref:Uncharacterized protein n=1 Tax=Strongylus vulgaris TaxID=40348 RepID=A0A3P7IQK3_STRVU|nr:unnamed protein product [Strongylus vulgaris]
MHAGKKVREKDVRQLSDGTLIIRGEEVSPRNVGGVGFVVHPSVVHPVDAHAILSPVIFRLHSLQQETTTIIKCYSPTSPADTSKPDAFYEGGNYLQI